MHLHVVAGREYSEVERATRLTVTIFPSMGEADTALFDANQKHRDSPTSCRNHP